MHFANDYLSPIETKITQAEKEAVENKAKLEAIEAKMRAQDGLAQNTQSNRQAVSQTNLLVQDSIGGVSSSPAAFFPAQAAAQAETQDKVAEMQAQMELMAKEIALLKEAQGGASSPNAAEEDADHKKKEDAGHKQELQELFR